MPADIKPGPRAISEPSPRLFYPGVNDLKAATVIVVDKDQKPQEYDFILAIQP